jgi:hypothetical protein
VSNQIHHPSSLFSLRKLSVLGTTLASIVLGACAESETSGETDASVPTGSSVSTPAQALQDDVDTLLMAISALDASVGSGARSSVVDAEFAKISNTINELALAAQQLREASVELAAGRTGVASQLSMRAGQIVPLLRKLKLAVRASDLDLETRDAVLTAVARVKMAAGGLNLSAGEYQASLNANDLRARMGESTLRNGPLFPGSSIWVLDEGHIDPIDAAFEDGAISLSIHDETAVPDVEREHEYTVMVVKAAAKVQVPDSRFAFIGPIGSNFWLLPEAQLDAQAAGILWPGLAADEVEPGVFVNDEVQFRFKQVIGPNGLSLFFSPADEASLPDVKMDSENGLPDIITVPAGSHQHLNWAFESAGAYVVKGTPWVTSSTELLKFVVLP